MEIRSSGVNNSDKNKSDKREVMVKVQRRGSSAMCNVMTTLVIGGIVIFAGYGGVNTINSWMSSPDQKAIKALTWNMAAINNNPFEYWISHDDKSYNNLMSGVSEYIKNPGVKDVPVHEVFTEEMFNELTQMMSDKKWSGIEETRTRWNTEYKNRKIISEFIKDDLIGLKRLVSMPDRVTNTISLSTKENAMRPTVINCYMESIDTSQKWWTQWKQFMFQKKLPVLDKYPSDMLSSIKHAKYPSITEEEEAISLPLQTMSLAIFDAILVHMMNSIDKKWTNIRHEICTSLNINKTPRVIDILSTTYRYYDILFLQEVGASFLDRMKDEKAIDNVLSKTHDMYLPSNIDTSRDQNSIILLQKDKYRNVKDITVDVIASYNSDPAHASSPLPVVNGDLICITADDAESDNNGGVIQYFFASFHGDTNGLATKAVLTAVHDYAVHTLPHHKVLFGMDANTYASPLPDQQGVVDFAKFYNSLNMNSCYGHNPNPLNFTTFHARTYLQPQLNKAITFEEKDIKGDKNPKDFIVFFNGDFQVVQTVKDNTGKKKYIEGMVFPTLVFPSDHGITSTILIENINR